MAKLDNSIRLSDIIVHYHASMVFGYTRPNTLSLYRSVTLGEEYDLFVQLDAPGKLRRCRVFALSELEAHMLLHELGFKVVNYKP